jgi:hypothetical protein
MEAMVFSALVTAWRFAGSPTSLSPVFVKATTEGVVLAPSAFAITVGFPPSMTATQLFVVPKSMPIILLIFYILLNCSAFILKFFLDT